MAKYKIVYDRPGCIGAFCCVALFPEYWINGIEGKAELAGGKQEGNNIVLEVELNAEEFEKMKAAAESCPVNVIHIFDEKGNKII